MSNKKEMAAMTTTAEAHALVPKLRFPEFLKTDGWRGEKLEKLVTTVNPPVKLQTSSYLLQGKFPIIDQSQDTICGWTNDESTLITESLPLIVFGDHTCTLKFVAKPFAQGADGIKIIKAKPVISAAYLFQSLNHSPLVMEDYKRHFSILKERVVYFPDVKTGEQQKIADCLASIDELITLESQKLDHLKLYKKGLIQQLFPTEGETVPRLRFPEFRDAEEWEDKALGALGSFFRGITYKSEEVAENGLLVLRSSNIQDGSLVLDKDLVFIEKSCSNDIKLRDGDILICMSNGSKALVGKNAEYHGNYEGDLTAGAFCSIFRSSIKFSRLIFQSDRYRRFISISIGGGNINNLKNSDLEEFKHPIPKLSSEKQKIADCLTSLDDRITAQNQKIETLKTHKKGLMQQLFPAPDGFSATQAGKT